MKIFKPNSKNTGHLFAFNVGPSKPKDNKDQTLALYLEIVKQNGWDATKKRGSFKDGQRISVKFNEFEIGTILSAIEDDFEEEVKLYHSFDDSGTQIFFSIRDNVTPVGYGLTVRKNKENYSMTFTRSELVLLRVYLQECALRIIASQEYVKE